MAWTSVGTTIANWPNLVRKLEITPDSTTATAITHGGPAQIPDEIYGYNANANPTATEWSVTASSTTTVTVDVEGTGARPVLFVKFYNQASGGIS